MYLREGGELLGLLVPRVVERYALVRVRARVRVGSGLGLGIVSVLGHRAHLTIHAFVQHHLEPRLELRLGFGFGSG